ncbi:MAG TPA: FkbM family methyltransferase [Puia sp.]|nr:FkbM family methyltransferase [Puia sp.]
MALNFVRKYLGIDISRHIVPKAEKPLSEQGQRKVQVGKFSLSANESHLIEEYLAIYKYYSRNLARIAKGVSETYEEGSIMDVGANIGDSIALIRSENCDSQIYAIEGDKNYFNLLKQNADSLFKKVVISNVFFGENKATIKSDLVAVGGTLNLKQNSDSDNNVEIITLDEYVAAKEIKNLKLIKVDTDGFDLMILRGGLKTIESQKPVLFFEYDDEYLKQNKEDGLETLNQLRGLGYDKIMYYDNYGRYLTSASLDDTAIIEDMYSYIRNGKGAFPYFDLCIFHNSDSGLADRIINKERLYFRNN